MSNETDVLEERREYLSGKIHNAQLRQEINAMESALNIHGANTNRMEGADPSYYTSDQIRKEVGFEDANNGPYTMPGDRNRGSFEPFISSETDLAGMRAIGRYFMNADCAGVGIKEAIVNYVVGEGFKYDVKQARQDAPENLRARVQAAVESFLEANDWCGCREEKPLEEILADGEVFLILRDHPDGIPRIRIRTGEHFVEPVDTQELEEYHGIESLDWSYGIATPWGQSEEPQAYFAQWYGDVNSWELLDASIVEHIKFNVPEDVKRGISDVYAAAKELERAGKGLNHAAVGAAIQATIALIEKSADGSTSADIESALTGPGYKTENVSGASGTYPVKFADQLSGRIMKTSGKDVMYGPMGGPRGAQLVEVFQAMLRRVAVRWGLTEFMVSGDASNNNMASSVVAESPMYRSMKRRQRKLSHPYVSLIWKAMGIMHDRGVFDEFDLPLNVIKKMVRIEVTADEPAERDQMVDENLRQLRHGAGLLSLKTWAEQVDIDLEEEIERGAKKQEAPASPFGGGGGGGPGGASPPQNPGRGAERPEPEQQPQRQPNPRGEDPTTRAVMEAAIDECQTIEQAKAVVRSAMEHAGPGDHPSGSSQEAHGGGGGGSDQDLAKKTSGAKASLLSNANFKAWFGNSKVVDEDGEPLVVYHGTAEKFTEFDIDRLGESTDDPTSFLGFQFSKKKQASEEYAEIAARSQADPTPSVMSTILKVENPRYAEAWELNVTDDFHADSQQEKQEAVELREYYKSEGYDGIIYKDADGNTNYIVFSPSQIKSATGNSGKFDPNSDDIIEHAVHNQKDHGNWAKGMSAGTDIHGPVVTITAGRTPIAPSSVSEKNTDIIANPSSRDLSKMAKEVEDWLGESPMSGTHVRAILNDKGDLFAWNSAKATHYAATQWLEDHVDDQALPLDLFVSNGKVVRAHVTDTAARTKWHNSPEAFSAITGAEKLARVSNIKNPEKFVTYWNQETEGDWRKDDITEHAVHNQKDHGNWADDSGGYRGDWVKAGIESFGTTDDPQEAGYILDDGSMLDFSGKNDGGTPGLRSYDHRDIGRAMEDSDGGNAGMRDFMRGSSAMRHSQYSYEDATVEVMGSIGGSQRRFLADQISNGVTYTWDVASFDGSTVVSGEFNSGQGLANFVEIAKRVGGQKFSSQADIERAVKLLEDDDLLEHAGPGDHPSGSPQTVHGKGGGAGLKAPTGKKKPPHEPTDLAWAMTQKAKSVFNKPGFMEDEDLDFVDSKLKGMEPEDVAYWQEKVGQDVMDNFVLTSMEDYTQKYTKSEFVTLVALMEKAPNQHQHLEKFLGETWTHYESKEFEVKKDTLSQDSEKVIEYAKSTTKHSGGQRFSEEAEYTYKNQNEPFYKSFSQPTDSHGRTRNELVDNAAAIKEQVAAILAPSGVSDNTVQRIVSGKDKSAWEDQDVIDAMVSRGVDPKELKKVNGLSAMYQIRSEDIDKLPAIRMDLHTGNITSGQHDRAIVKEGVVKAISTRLSEKFQSVDPKQINTLTDALDSGGNEDAFRRYGSSVENYITASFVDTWAGSSSDSKETSLLLQFAAQERFETLDIARTGNMGAMQAKQAKHVLKKAPDAMRAVIDSFYEETQDQLKAQGVEELILFRGMKGSSHVPTTVADDKVMNAYATKIESDDMRVGDRFAVRRRSLPANTEGKLHITDENIHQNPLSSWSWSLGDARDFAGTARDNGTQNAIVMTRKVRREEIFSIPTSGPGCLCEEEAVVIGSAKPKPVKAIAGDDHPSDPNRLFEIIRDAKDF